MRQRLLQFRLRLRTRRGSALMLTMVFTFALGGLAISAIYMAGGTAILSKLYDRERDYRYAAEWALALGKSRIMTDTTFVLPDSLYVQILNGSTVTQAGGGTVPKVRVDLYAGVGGNSTGQYGRFVELVAVAYDNGGARHVRRLELQAENFARYAMFTDRWSPGCYTTGEIVRGRAHSNADWQSCGSAPGPVYTDTVSAVNTVTGTAQYPSAGHRYPNAPRIPFPTVSKLAWMPGYAASANLAYTPPARVASTGATRMEFTAVDLDGDGLLTGPAEGYFRVFEARAGATTNPWATGSSATPYVTGGTDTAFVRAGTTNGSRFDNILAAGTTINKSVIQNQCGVFYQMGNPARAMFMPLAAHDTLDKRYRWFIDTLTQAVLGRPGSRPNAIAYLRNYQPGSGGYANNSAALLKNGSAYTTGTPRCFPAGDPYLMPVERPGLLNAFPAAAGQSIDTLPNASKRGGEDTTFTAVTKTGSWRSWAGFGASFFTAGATRRQAVEEPYLWPVHRTQNLNSKGVIYVNGDIFLSGQFRGRATLYISGNGEFIDDLVYVTNPASLPICQNLLGIITGGNLYIADNTVNRPRFVDGTGASNARFFDNDQDFFLHAVTLVGVSNTNATFGVEALSSGPNAGRLCTPVPPNSAQTSGGCINQAGGVIQRVISATFAGGYTGYAENRVKDACLDVDSPPYFPLTGRYLDNEFYEIDPAQFNAIGVAQFYRRLQSSP
ncbi:MAG: hypothetical protein IT359_19895 [Gemmatimonadaceae bacterium]|nr:hypothetical protein [Gemmatimonadaceae bacterium]